MSIPRAIASATFTIFGVTLHCHVLDDGTRVIEEQDVAALIDSFGAPAGHLDLDDPELERFARWQRGREEPSNG